MISRLDYFSQGTFSPHSGNLTTLQTQLHWTFRVTVALTFIGHGVWGLFTKSGWLPFFASQGIEPDIAWRLQRPIGVLDIALGVLILWKPRRLILMWMFVWAGLTAMLRPLAANLMTVQVDGEWTVQLDTSSLNVPKMQTWEFWERAGNWGPPFLLLLLGGAFCMRMKDWVQPYTEPPVKESTVDTIFFLCRIVLGLLLIGHAGFGFAAEKQMLIDHWQSIGIDADVAFITNVGYAELALGILVMLVPVRALIWVALSWKLFTELLYVPADSNAGKGIFNIFETIERWGDFGVPLAMLFIIGYRRARTVPTPSIAEATSEGGVDSTV